MSMLGCKVVWHDLISFRFLEHLILQCFTHPCYWVVAAPSEPFWTQSWTQRLQQEEPKVLNFQICDSTWLKQASGTASPGRCNTATKECQCHYEHKNCILWDTDRKVAVWQEASLAIEILIPFLDMLIDPFLFVPPALHLSFANLIGHVPLSGAAVHLPTLFSGWYPLEIKHLMFPHLL